MRIAHVLTYVSNDGAFGGPVAVADAQTRELARRGHQVKLLAGWDGKAEVDIPGVDVQLFPTSRLGPLGFSGLLAPTLTQYLRECSSELDVVHIHMGRHAISLSAARLSRHLPLPYVLQTHGMVMPDRRIKSRIVDALGVRSALTDASRVLALTSIEQAGLHTVAPRIDNVQLIRNGIAALDTVERTTPTNTDPEVLFLARLHPRKRVMAFAEMAALLEKRGVAARFTVVGPDEGDLAALEQFIRVNSLRNLIYEGSIAPGTAPERLSRAEVFVLPSVGEVFPMTVLESLSVRTPVVLTDDCGISAELAAQDAAMVTDGSASALADAVATLLLDADRRASVLAGMASALKNTFGISAVAADLEAIYQSAAVTRA